MPRLPLAFLAALTGLLWASFVQADHFAIDLEVQSAKITKTAHAAVLDADAKPVARDVLMVKTGDAITVKWALSNTDPKVAAKDVLVHFFVVKEEKTGQATVPKLTKDLAAESALTMDFQPQDKAEGTVTFAIDKPGSYLVRLETKGAAGKDGHEQFAAIDLLVR
jgi:hypothetical protein